MTPTPQKNPREIATSCIRMLTIPRRNVQNVIIRVEKAILTERTAYNALLDKVQRVEAERDDLKNRVDSEYDRGVEDARKVAENTPNPNYGSSKAEPHWKLIAEAILKLRRV